MKLTGGGIVLELEMVEAKALAKLLGAMSKSQCEELYEMNEDEIKSNSNIYSAIHSYFETVL